MRPYLHHLPGRLSLRLAPLRRCAQRAASAEAALLRLDGVISAEVSVLTGRVRIYYDTAAADSLSFWEALTRELAVHGWQGRIEGPRSPRASGRGTGTAHAVGVDRLAATLTEKLVERCALALLAALL